jgi:hypothetical protein
MEVYRTNFGAIIRTKAPGVVVSEVDELIKRTDKLLFEVDKSLIDYSDSTPEQKQLDHWLLQEINAVDTNHSLPESEMVRRNLLTYREYFSKSRELGIMSEEEYLEALQYLNDLEVDFGFAIANNGRSSNRLLTRIYGFVKDTAASVPNDTGRIGRIGKLSSEFACRVFDKGFGYVSKKLDDFGNFIDRHKKAAACFGAGVLLPVGAIVADVVLSSGCISYTSPIPVINDSFEGNILENMTFDASKSYGGHITGYKWVLRQGYKIILETDYSQDPVLVYAFKREGNYTGFLWVKNDNNKSAMKKFQVNVKYLDSDSDGMSDLFEKNIAKTDPLKPNRLWAVLFSYNIPLYYSMDIAKIFNQSYRVPNERIYMLYDKVWQENDYRITNKNMPINLSEYVKKMYQRSLDDVYGDPTVLNFTSVIDEISKKSTDDDRIFIFLDSHGNKRWGISFKPEDIITFKNYSLTYEELNKIVDRPKGIKVVAIEACYSGSAIKYMNNGDKIVITSMGENESGFGCIRDGLYEAFNWPMVPRPEFRPDTDNNGYVSLNEALDFVKDSCTSFGQHWQLADPKNYLSQDLYLGEFGIYE